MINYDIPSRFLSMKDAMRESKLGLLIFVFLNVWLCNVTIAAEKNIILFVTDDEGMTMGCYGDQVAVTPNIDALAADGTRFTNAFATTASCSASRSVILSGLHNHKNGQYGHQHHFHKFASYANVVALSLPRTLNAAGYRTGHIGKYHVAPEEVYRFETYLKGPLRNPVAMAEACRDFVENVGDRNDSQPFFLYFATSDPHRGGGKDERSTLKLKPNLFGNLPNGSSHPGVEEVFFKDEDIDVPAFLPDTPETRSELSQYYQSCARIDQGLGKLIEILKENDLYDKTLIVRTSDHGMAFAGGKTTVYDPGLKVPFVVRNPYESDRGVVSNALISHVDVTPSLLDFAGALDLKHNRPRNWQNPDQYWQDKMPDRKPNQPQDNRSGRNRFRSYHGKSWLPILSDSEADHWEAIFASHTFHEIQMYYPMRVVRDHRYKLIWNIANRLDYPFATDLWAASSWQAQFQQGPDAKYGMRTVEEYIHRPPFELYDIRSDPDEANNLAMKPEFAAVLKEYQQKLKDYQQRLEDPWITKWNYE